MKTVDSLGRRRFEKQNTKPVNSRLPTEREVRWLQFLNLHGFASSLYLHEYTLDTHQCFQTSSRMLRRLFDNGMISKPEQQLATAGALGHHHIYALTQSGCDYLKDQNRLVKSLSPTGPWVHQYMVSCITATIHVLSSRAGYRFIPGHEITSSLAVEVPFTWRGKQHQCKLIPDSLFAIEYPSGFMAYALEADRHTEPNDSTSPYRKSVRRNVKQYAEFVGTQQYKQSYGLNCPLMVLNVTTSNTHAERALKIIDDEIGACRYYAYGVAETFRTPFKPPKGLLSNLFNGSLLRNGFEEFRMASQ